MDVTGLEPAVGTGNDADRVFPLLVDGDHRNPAGTVRRGQDPFAVDAVLLEAPAQGVTGGVISESPDQVDLGAEPRGGDGLVGTFPAGNLGEAGSGDGLARTWQAGTAHDVVEVDRSHDHDAGSGFGVIHGIRYSMFPAYRSGQSGENLPVVNPATAGFATA